MATVVPPPSKRQKLAASEKSRLQQDLEVIPDDAGSLKFRFYDEITGLPIGDGPILVSIADATPKNLEALANQMQSHDESEYIPYKVTLEVPDSKTSETASIPYPTNIYKTLVVPGKINTEGELKLVLAPQAVFRVRVVTRSAFSISGHGEAILATQFSPRKSSRMVTGSGDNTARIWDTETGTPYQTLKGHTSWVLAVSWSPDESLIATGSNDKTVRVWNPKSGKAFGRAMTGHTKFIRALVWEPYHLQQPGRPRLASASEDATIRVWSVNQQTIEIVLSGHKGSVSCVKWGGEGAIYTASHDKTVKIWNSTDGTLRATLNSHAHWINHLALSTDHVLRTGYFDHTDDIPDTEEKKIAKAKKRFLDVATIQGKVVERLVSASDDFTMYLWEPSEATKPVQRMVGHQKQVNHVAFSPDGILIASCGFDNHTKIWGARDGKFINTLRGHVAPVYQCAFSADSRLLVTCSKDTTLKVWDMRTHKLSSDLPGHKDEVYAVDWSPDGQKVGSGGKDKAVRIWRH